MFVNTELWVDVARMVLRLTGERQPACSCPTHASSIFGQAIIWHRIFGLILWSRATKLRHGRDFDLVLLEACSTSRGSSKYPLVGVEVGVR